MDFENLLINKGADIKTAMKLMDNAGQAILFIIDRDERLIGCLTDGDIRRWILKTGSLEGSILAIFNTNPICVYDPYNVEEVKKLMTLNKIEVIPVISMNNKMVDVLVWNDIFKDETKPAKTQIDIPVVIMAGGAGKRLEPFTRVLPKPLIPINDKTIIEIIIDSFLPYGIRNFFITLFYKSKIIKSYFDELSPEYFINYIYEKKPLGTSGSLKLLTGKVNETFFLTNCDVLVKADFADILNVHENQKNDITMVTSLKHYKIPYGICEIENRGSLKHFEEKPEFSFLVNTGLYVMNSSVLDVIPENTIFHITHLIEKIKGKGRKVGIYPVNEKSWVDIGEWAQYKKALKEL